MHKTERANFNHMTASSCKHCHYLTNLRSPSVRISTAFMYPNKILISKNGWMNTSSGEATNARSPTASLPGPMHALDKFLSFLCIQRRPSYSSVSAKRYHDKCSGLAILIWRQSFVQVEQRMYGNGGVKSQHYSWVISELTKRNCS